MKIKGEKWGPVKEGGKDNLFDGGENEVRRNKAWE